MVGIVFSNVPFLRDSILIRPSWDNFLRKSAFVLILVRCAVGLNPKTLRKSLVGRQNYSKFIILYILKELLQKFILKLHVNVLINLSFSYFDLLLFAGRFFYRFRNCGDCSRCPFSLLSLAFQFHTFWVFCFFLFSRNCFQFCIGFDFSGSYGADNDPISTAQNGHPKRHSHNGIGEVNNL